VTSIRMSGKEGTKERATLLCSPSGGRSPVTGGLRRETEYSKESSKLTETVIKEEIRSVGSCEIVSGAYGVVQSWGVIRKNWSILRSGALAASK